MVVWWHMCRLIKYRRDTLLFQVSFNNFLSVRCWLKMITQQDTQDEHKRWVTCGGTY